VEVVTQVGSVLWFRSNEGMSGVTPAADLAIQDIQKGPLERGWPIQLVLVMANLILSGK